MNNWELPLPCCGWAHWSTTDKRTSGAAIPFYALEQWIRTPGGTRRISNDHDMAESSGAAHLEASAGVEITIMWLEHWRRTPGGIRWSCH